VILPVRLSGRAADGWKMDVRLSELNAKYYRSVSRSYLTELPQLSVFVGRNNAGKSNVLDVLSFLHEASTTGLEGAISSRGSSRDDLVIAKNDGRSVELEVLFSVSHPHAGGLLVRIMGSDKEGLVGALTKAGFLSRVKYYFSMRENRTFEEISIQGMEGSDDWIKVINREDGRFRRGGRRNIDDELRTWDGNSLIESVEIVPSYSGGESIGRIAFADFDLTTDDSLVAEVIEIVRRSLLTVRRVGPALADVPEMAAVEVIDPDPNSKHLVQHLFSLSNNNPELFHSIERAVRELVPELGPFQTLIRGNSVTFASHDLNSPGVFYTYEQLSQGVRRLLSIITALFGAQDGGIVLLEEPELHLHPSVQSALARILVLESSRLIVMVATHSPVIASAVPRDSLYLVYRAESGDTRVDPARSGESVVDRLVEELGIRPSHSFDAEALVFVEGRDDLGAYRVFATRCGLESKVQIIDMGGAENVEYYVSAKLLRAKRVRQDVSAILDGDQAAASSKRRAAKRAEELGIDLGRVLCLSKLELEEYFLDPELIRATFPERRLEREEVDAAIAAFPSERGPKQQLHRALNRLGVRDSPALANRRLAKALPEVPKEIQTHFAGVRERIQQSPA
jgi:predicted ATPase